jgi:polyisoprenoid-binding protein YceI
MRIKLGCLMITCLLLAGCDKPVSKTATTTSTSKTNTTESTTAKSESGGEQSVATTTGAESPTADSVSAKKGDTADPSLGAAATRAPIDSGVAKLTPENTKIIFVGTHVGPKPDPRTGGFKEFKGEAVVDGGNKSLKSVEIEIDTSSIWTQFGKLTEHLKSPDFFETREYPTAKFVSKSIEPGRDEGSFVIKGELTLLKATKEVEVPATVSVDDRGLMLKADFKIDRTEFGMDRMQQNVEKEVALSVVVGEKTDPLPSAG